MIKQWPTLKKYYGIDLWRQQQNYKDDANVNDAEQEKTMIRAIKLLDKFRKQIKIIRDFSNVAAREFQEK